MSQFGLNKKDLEHILETISFYPAIEKAVIFGSRAMGTHKKGSDVDIAIYGEQVTWDLVTALHAKLEDEGPLPYLFDIVDAAHLQHDELKEHIERAGKLIYESSRM